MIIDSNGHQATAKPALQEFRAAQFARLSGPALPGPAEPQVSDEIRAKIKGS
jgi:hypothetical protein